MKYLLSVITITLVVFASCSEIPTPVFPEEEIKELNSGGSAQYSGTGEVYKIISSRPVFEAEWKEVHQNRDPKPELPNVDFNERTVVLVVLDRKPSAGYTIDSHKLFTDNEALIFAYTEKGPGPNCGTASVITRPYTFVSIPNQNQDKEVKVIKDNVVSEDCSE